MSNTTTYCKLIRAADDESMMEESNWAAQIKGDASLSSSFVLLQEVEDGEPKEERDFKDDEVTLQEHEHCITWMTDETSIYRIYPADVQVYKAADGTFWCREDQVDNFFVF